MAVPTSYRPGNWFGIIGERATVLLPPTEKERAATLWSLVDAGGGFDDVLDALVAGGLANLPGFVLVAHEANGDGQNEARVIVRGDDAALSIDTTSGVVLLAGSSDTVWTEQTVPGVRRLAVVVEDLDEPSYIVSGGLVRVGGIESPAASGSAISTSPVAVTPEVEEPPLAAGQLDLEPPTDSIPPAPPLAAVPAPMPAIEELPDFGDDEPTGNIPLQMPDIEPDPIFGDADEEPEAEPEPTAYRPTAKLSFSNGELVDVDQVIVVGRAPEASRILTDTPPRLVAVPSPHHEISSTHLEVRPGTGPDAGFAMVTDLGSTNGTIVVPPGGRPEDLRPGVPVRLQVGSLIDLGDGLTIQVS
jgi:hypothetical protein